MNVIRSVGSLVLAAAGPLVVLSACQVYVDEPAKRPPPPPVAQTAPAPPKAAPAPPKEVKIIPLHLHGLTPAGGGTAPASPCLDSGGTTVGDCAAMQAATACPTAPTPQQKCNVYKTYFAPKIAAAAVSCLTSLSSAQVCDATQVAACGRTALAQACAAPAVSQLCQIAAGPCKTSAADCTAIISGLDDQGQQAIAQCVAQGCSAGLSACIDGLVTGATAVSSKH